jgi:hypothetical protein
MTGERPNHRLQRTALPSVPPLNRSVGPTGGDSLRAMRTHGGPECST